ncbi:MAG: zinc ribbon domain-containing protein [Candidatus Rokubacteria bacterium]|nr:zinc ribbon domain-containing protein [Candidatus Rokubacteria bacterium]
MPVICPQCRFQNEADAAFCTHCGARLERLCPSCRTPNPSEVLQAVRPSTGPAPSG